jgi:hypothetical protein
LNTARKTIALAHKTFLASVGVYDSGREIAANKFDQLFVDGSILANDLLKKGESLEAQLQAKIEAKRMLQDKISALKARLGFGSESRDQQIDMLSQRVDSLIEVVAKLAQQKAAAKKTPATASSTKKTATTVTKVATKPTAAKPAAAKPAAAKSRAAKAASVKPTVKPVKPIVTKTAAVQPTESGSTSKTKVEDKD